MSEGSVYNCNDHTLKIVGIGTIKLKFHDGRMRTIREVRHLEGLRKNLLSLGQLDEFDCKIVVEKWIKKVIRGALVLMKGVKGDCEVIHVEGRDFAGRRIISCFK